MKTPALHIQVEILAGEDSPEVPHLICIVEPVCEEWTEAEIADAHLIAAAPELLGACRVVTAFLDKLEKGTDESDPLAQLRRQFHTPLRAALNPAIAKAEGRA